MLKFTVPQLRQKWLEWLFISGVVHIASERTMNAGSSFHIFLHTHCLFCLERASRSKIISGGWFNLCTSCFGTLRSIVRMCSPWPVLHVLLPLVLGIVPPNVSEGEIPTSMGNFQKKIWMYSWLLPNFNSFKKRNWFVYPPVIDSTMRHGYVRPLSDLSSMMFHDWPDVPQCYRLKERLSLKICLLLMEPS